MAVCYNKLWKLLIDKNMSKEKHLWIVLSRMGLLLLCPLNLL